MNTPKKPFKAITVSEEIKEIEHLASLLSANPEIKVEAEFTFLNHGIDYLMKNTVDLLFLDIQFSDINCLSFLHFLLGIKSQQPPVVVFLTNSKDETIEFFVNGGFEYLLKPVSKSQLDLFIENFIMQRKDFDFRDKMKNILEKMN
jgi:two-component SAPR family response regulator